MDPEVLPAYNSRRYLTGAASTFCAIMIHCSDYLLLLFFHCLPLISLLSLAKFFTIPTSFFTSTLSIPDSSTYQPGKSPRGRPKPEEIPAAPRPTNPSI